VQERKIKEYSSDNSRPTTDILDCGLDKNTNVKLFCKQTDRHMYLPTSYEETDTLSHSPCDQTDTLYWLICLEKILVIPDNLGWYYDITNVFIRQRQIQIIT
jgi:hypothetical protein